MERRRGTHGALSLIFWVAVKVNQVQPHWQQSAWISSRKRCMVGGFLIAIPVRGAPGRSQQLSRHQGMPRAKWGFSKPFDWAIRGVLVPLIVRVRASHHEHGVYLYIYIYIFVYAYSS